MDVAGLFEHSTGSAHHSMTARTDFSEFADQQRVLHWEDHVEPDGLLDEAIGHAVALREALYEGNYDEMTSNRALILVAVLNRLREVSTPASC